jgi:hypothetical protein
MARRAADRVLVHRYALQSPLGRGGMGVVWRAHDVMLGREVAVKEVAFPASMPDAERHSAQARVTREARAAARLNHPGVVTLYVNRPGIRLCWRIQVDGRGWVSRASREVQLPVVATPVSQASTRTRLSASAVSTCCRWVLARPR